MHPEDHLWQSPVWPLFACSPDAQQAENQNQTPRFSDRYEWLPSQPGQGKFPVQLTQPNWGSPAANQFPSTGLSARLPPPHHLMCPNSQVTSGTWPQMEIALANLASLGGSKAPNDWMAAVIRASV